MSHYQNFEPLFEIPNSWEWVKLGEIGLWQSGATPSKSNPNYYGKGYPWLNTGDLNDGYISSIPKEITQLALRETSVKLNPVGSVLIAMYGATIGKLGILNIDATTNQACCACYKYWINQKYLFFFLLAWRPQFIQMGGGGAQPNISKEKIEATHIPCPPANEQLRIVRQIEFLFELLDKLDINRNVIEKTIENTKSKILELSMQGKLVPQDPTDEPASEMLKRINPNAKIITDNPHSWNIPQTWSICRLGDIVRISSAKRVMKSDWHSQGVPFYRTREIVKLSDYGTVDNELFISHEQYEEFKKQYGIPKRGDIMLTAVGTIGKTYIVKSNDKFYYKDASVLCLSPTSLISSEFLEMLFKDENLIKQMKENSKGTTVDTITIEKAFNYLIVLPPLKEQMRIVAKIEELYSCLDNIEASLQS